MFLSVGRSWMVRFFPTISVHRWFILLSMMEHLRKLQKKGGCLATTTLIENFKPNGLAFFAGDESNNVTHSLELFCLIVWNFNVEFLFESHDKLDGIERVGTEVLNELGF